MAEQIAVSEDFNKAVDQVILDSKRLHGVVNGDGLASIVTEDGSLIPSVRKALLDNLYFKTPPIAWKQGTQVSVFNQLYAFTEAGATSWWYAPTATQSTIVLQGVSPKSDPKWRAFLNQTGEDPSKKYAPIDSPKFTGNPRAPKPAKGDSSDTIPTTSWVGDAIKAIVDGLDDLIAALDTFENITVKNDAVLNKVSVAGGMNIVGNISATRSNATLQKITLVTETAEIAFEQNGATPPDVVKKTNIKPYTVTTGTVNTDNLNSAKMTVGAESTSGVSSTLKGNTVADYVRIKGNTATSADVPQLIVDGKTRLHDVEILGEVSGLKADVEGIDIHPSSVTTGRIATETLEVSHNTNLIGKTTVGQLEITGEVTGLGLNLNVDGKDIKPNSVATTGEATVGTNLSIGQDLVVSGTSTVKDLTVEGKLRADIDLSDKDLNVRSIKTASNSDLAGQTTIKDLKVTGQVQGLPEPDVAGKDITPKSVVTSGNVTVGGNLQVNGTFGLTDVTLDNITVKEVTNVKDLNITGEVTGLPALPASVDGLDILPKSVTTTNDVTVGGSQTVTGTLGVTGKTTVGDLHVGGALSGVTIDIDGQDISVKNLTVTGTTTLTGDATASKIASGEITNTGKITTKDLYVSGNFVDENGQPVAPTMDGLDINPKNVNATGSLKGQSVTTVGGITSGGNMHSKGTLAVDGDAGVTGDFNVAGQTATVNDLVVKGSLRDGNGNPIGSAESIEGKDILPKSVTATESVSALSLSAADSITAVGPITGESLTVTGEVNGGSLAVSGAASIEGVATVGGLTTEGSVTTNELILKRKAGQTGDKLRVEGNALVEGDLNVSGTINGEIDLSSKNITALSATVTGDIGAVNVTASNDVTAQRVVAGSADMGKVGLDVANNANVGGNLKVTGTITGQLDLSNNAVAAKTLTVTGETNLKATTVTDLTVTGEFSLANNDVVAKSLEADKVTAPKFSVTPKDVLPSSATYTPDGTTNVYNVNVQTAFAVNAPAGLVGGGKSESIYIYFEQDATGHEVTWSNSFVVHGTGTKVSTTPSSVTICNLVYRGKGNLIDVFMTTRP